MLIYEALEKDHVRLLQLVDELLDLEEGDHRYHFLIEEIRDLLIPHSRAEESVFYNSLRSLEIAKDTVMHSYREHMEAEGILRTLQVKDKLDADWRQTARKLKTALEHHIREEEGRVFEVARQIFTREEAEMMAEAFEKLKPEVQKEGFLKTTLDMIANVMPPRFAASLRTFNLNPRE